MSDTFDIPAMAHFSIQKTVSAKILISYNAENKCFDMFSCSEFVVFISERYNKILLSSTGI